MPKLYFDGEEIPTGGTDVEVGDTLVKKNGIIDVFTPVNGVISQEEFDLLSEEKKNNGLYIIQSMTDQGSLFPFGNAEIYSEEETRIGTWIDGKPLYRKVISGKTGNSYGKDVWSEFASVINVDFVVNLHGTIDSKLEKAYTVSNYTNVVTDSYQFIMFYNYNTNKIMYNITHSTLTNNPLIIIIEYTKTTDKPDNATHTRVSD